MVSDAGSAEKHSLFDPAVFDRINTHDPERVTAQIERFSERIRGDRDLTAFCFDEPRHLDMLVTLLAGSAFVADILVRDPELFRSYATDLAEARMRLRESERTAVEMEREVLTAIASADSYERKKIALRRFHREELFRIVASDLLGFWDMPTVTSQLSMLAGSMIRSALDVASEAASIVPAGLAIVGMGKLGGRELNYSSDIDLLFVAGSDARRYSRVGERLIDVLGGITSEGFLYRVDMRLRPWGRSGALVHTVDAYEKYLRTHGEAWEKQALLKARVLAGNHVVGQEFIDRMVPIVYGQEGNAVRRSILDMKNRIEADLEKRGQRWGNVKQGRGSIRDVEFTVQYLQLLHGGSDAAVRTPSTRIGLSALNEARYLSEDEFRVLSEGYTFLRVVEHHLQLYHNRQTHSIPTDGDRVEQLARRLEFEEADPGSVLIRQYEQHATSIREVFRRIVGHDRQEGANDGLDRELPPLAAGMAPAYREFFSQEERDRHAQLAERLSAKHPVVTEAGEAGDGNWQLTVVGYDYLGELSIISGLLLAYGFDILDGQIFTDERRSEVGGRKSEVGSRKSEVGAQRQRKIVDVFTVRPVADDASEETWRAYGRELEELVADLAAQRPTRAQGRLAAKVAESSARQANGELPTLYPVDIVIDNESDEWHTVLHIEAPDTVGFLYELTNALSLLNINIATVSVASAVGRVRDTLHVTNVGGQKITDDAQQRQLRFATVLVQHFTHLLPHASNPTAALLQFRSLLGELLSRDDWSDEIASLQRPEVLDALTRLLGVSDFLWNDFLRMQHETLFPIIGDIEGLKKPHSKQDILHDFESEMAKVDGISSKVEVLNLQKDHHMFRIDMRYILGHISRFGDFANELTDLAEVVVEQALELSLSKVESVAGRPLFEDGSACPLCVFGLGKFGGREMGFASDIELLFVYEASGHSSGPAELTNSQYFDRVAQEFMQVIRSKKDGVFEVDLRLRPYGSTASLATSVAAFRRYFSIEGAAWPYERQLLLKLRPVAGDPALAGLVTKLKREILSSIGMFDAGSMRAMRERQLRHLVKPGTLNVKYSPGALVDIEYLVQALQISYCHRHEDLLDCTNTREALGSLRGHHIIDDEDHAVLDEALILLRRVIDGLRMVRGNARDLAVPPADSQEMMYLARRMRSDSPSDLRDEVLERMAAVAAISSKLLA